MVGGQLMNVKFLLFGRDRTENSLIRFVDRKIREQRRDERRFAEQRTTQVPIPGKKIVHRRRAQLSRCSTISGASRRAIRLESSDSHTSDLIYSESVGSRTFETINSSTG